MPRNVNMSALVRYANLKRDGFESLQLQGVGRVPAIFVSEMNVGDVIVFNYGYRYRVTQIERITDKFVKVSMKSEKDGTKWGQRMKLDRLVAVLESNSPDRFKKIMREID